MVCLSGFLGKMFANLAKESVVNHVLEHYAVNLHAYTTLYGAVQAIAAEQKGHERGPCPKTSGFKCLSALGLHTCPRRADEGEVGAAFISL